LSAEIGNPGPELAFEAGPVGGFARFHALLVLGRSRPISLSRRDFRGLEDAVRPSRLVHDLLQCLPIPGSVTGEASVAGENSASTASGWSRSAASSFAVSRLMVPSRFGFNPGVGESPDSRIAGELGREKAAQLAVERPQRAVTAGGAPRSRNVLLERVEDPDEILKRLAKRLGRAFAGQGHWLSRGRLRNVRMSARTTSETLFDDRW
jgi:hypothetical protein